MDYPRFPISEMHLGIFPDSMAYQSAIPKKNKCRKATRSKIPPILTRETNCLYDIRAFSCDQFSWSSTRTIRFVHKTLAEWRRPRFRRSMGQSSISTQRNTYGNGPGRFVQVKITGCCSASDCIGSVLTRECSKQRATKLLQVEDNSKTSCWSENEDAQLQSPELFKIEDFCKTSCWSNGESSKFQSLERSCWERSSHQESKREKRQRGEESGLMLLVESSWTVFERRLM